MCPNFQCPESRYRDAWNTVAVADQCDHVPVRLSCTLGNHERLHKKVVVLLVVAMDSLKVFLRRLR